MNKNQQNLLYIGLFLITIYIVYLYMIKSKFNQYKIMENHLLEISKKIELDRTYGGISREEINEIMKDYELANELKFVNKNTFEEHVKTQINQLEDKINEDINRIHKILEPLSQFNQKHEEITKRILNIEKTLYSVEFNKGILDQIVEIKQNNSVIQSEINDIKNDHIRKIDIIDKQIGDILLTITSGIQNDNEENYEINNNIIKDINEIRSMFMYDDNLSIKDKLQEIIVNSLNVTDNTDNNNNNNNTSEYIKYVNNSIDEIRSMLMYDDNLSIKDKLQEIITNGLTSGNIELDNDSIEYINNTLNEIKNVDLPNQKAEILKTLIQKEEEIYNILTPIDIYYQNEKNIIDQIPSILTSIETISNQIDTLTMSVDSNTGTTNTGTTSTDTEDRISEIETYIIQILNNRILDIQNSLDNIFDDKIPTLENNIDTSINEILNKQVIVEQSINNINIQLSDFTEILNGIGLETKMTGVLFIGMFDNVTFTEDTYNILGVNNSLLYGDKRITHVFIPEIHSTKLYEFWTDNKTPTGATYKVYDLSNKTFINNELNGKTLRIFLYGYDKNLIMRDHIYATSYNVYDCFAVINTYGTENVNPVMEVNTTQDWNFMVKRDFKMDNNPFSGTLVNRKKTGMLKIINYENSGTSLMNYLIVNYTEDNIMLKLTRVNSSENLTFTQYKMYYFVVIEYDLDYMLKNHIIPLQIKHNYEYIGSYSLGVNSDNVLDKYYLDFPLLYNTIIKYTSHFFTVDFGDDKYRFIFYDKNEDGTDFYWNNNRENPKIIKLNNEQNFTFQHYSRRPLVYNDKTSETRIVREKDAFEYVNKNVFTKEITDGITNHASVMINLFAENSNDVIQQVLSKHIDMAYLGTYELNFHRSAYNYDQKVLYTTDEINTYISEYFLKPYANSGHLFACFPSARGPQLYNVNNFNENNSWYFIEFNKYDTGEYILDYDDSDFLSSIGYEAKTHNNYIKTAFFYKKHDLISSVTNLQTTTSNIQSNVNTTQNNITTLQSNVNTAQNNITTLQSDVNTAQNNITTLQSNVNDKASKSGLNSIINKLKNEVDALIYNTNGGFYNILGFLNSVYDLNDDDPYGNTSKRYENAKINQESLSNLIGTFNSLSTETFTNVYENQNEIMSMIKQYKTEMFSELRMVDINKISDQYTVFDRDIINDIIIFINSSKSLSCLPSAKRDRLICHIVKKSNPKLKRDVLNVSSYIKNLIGIE